MSPFENINPTPNIVKTSSSNKYLVALIGILLIIFLSVASFVGYRVFQSRKAASGENNQTSDSQKVVEATSGAQIKQPTVDVFEGKVIHRSEDNLEVEDKDGNKKEYPLSKDVLIFKYLEAPSLTPSKNKGDILLNKNASISLRGPEDKLEVVMISYLEK